jgi:signal transduction histidine kinase
LTSVPSRCLVAVVMALALDATALLLLAALAHVRVDAPLVVGLFGLSLLGGAVAAAGLAPLRQDLALIVDMAAGDRSAFERPSQVSPRTAEASALLDGVKLVCARSAELEKIEAKARRAVEEAERVRVSFVAAMGHDLRGPLNSIIGFSDLLVMEGHDAVALPQRPSVEIIRRSAQDLLVLLEQILVWAKLEAGQIVFDKHPVQLDDVIADAVRDALARSADRGLTVELDVEEGLPPLEVDRARVAQALLGLMDNATRAPDRPRLELSACRLAPDEKPARIRLELRDPQLCVREADHDSFFEPFRPSYAPSGRRLSGLGLGPALARALIRAHGGQVWFSSRADTGTTFTIELPV